MTRTDPSSAPTHVKSASPCYLCRRARGLVSVVPSIDSPVCALCACDLGQLLVRADGRDLGLVWAVDGLPAALPGNTARWHATAALKRAAAG